MPKTRVVFYREEDGTVPMVQWLDGLETKARAKCVVKLGRLAEFGHELRRPDADFLRDSIYELRTHKGHVQYRMLYFFYGKQAVVVSHGLTKESAIPSMEIDKVIDRKLRYVNNPSKHMWEES